jgi:type IV secretory pathway component VirB8
MQLNLNNTLIITKLHAANHICSLQRICRLRAHVKTALSADDRTKAQIESAKRICAYTLFIMMMIMMIMISIIMMMMMMMMISIIMLMFDRNDCIKHYIVQRRIIR